MVDSLVIGPFGVTVVEIYLLNVFIVDIGSVHLLGGIHIGFPVEGFPFSKIVDLLSTDSKENDVDDQS